MGRFGQGQWTEHGLRSNLRNMWTFARGSNVLRAPECVRWQLAAKWG